MLKKGFTLVELMAIVLIVGIVALVIIPNIDRVIERHRQNSYDSQVRTIELAANNFAIDNININTIEEDEFVYITLAQLKIGGYITDDIINPITRNPFSGETIIKISKVGNNFIFEVYPEETTDMEALVNVRMVGDVIEVICENSIYVEKGVIARDSYGVALDYEKTYLDDQANELVTFDNQSMGTYFVRYRVQTDAGTTTVMRTLIISDE